MKPFNSQPERKLLTYASDGFNYEVWLVPMFYGGGREALVLESDMGRVAVATVNLPDAPPDGFLHIKTWAENRAMLPFLVANGIVEDTGQDVDTGSPYVRARLVKKGPNYPGQKAVAA